MRQSKLLSVNLIKVGARARVVNDDCVVGIMESIKKQGLNTPIIVRKDASGQYRLIAGAHRLEAFKRLGKPRIEALVETIADDDRARMIELSENLHRSELTELERAEHLAEWMRLSDKLAQRAPVSGGRGKTGGVRAAARDLGIDRTTAHRAVKIASLSSEAKAKAKATGQDDNQSTLLIAARHETPEEQVLALQERTKQKEQETSDAEKSAQIAKKFREICRLVFPHDWAEYGGLDEEDTKFCDQVADTILKKSNEDLADYAESMIMDLHERETKLFSNEMRKVKKAEERAAKKKEREEQRVVERKKKDELKDASNILTRMAEGIGQ